MTNVKKLIEEGKLTQHLMADTKFTERAKKLFKEKNINTTNKNLKEIFKAIEKTVSENKVLEDDELKQIVGGISEKTIARGIIKTITTAAGAKLGSYVGKNLPLQRPFSTLTESISDYVPGTLKDIAHHLNGDWVGTGIGGALGYDLGELICEKCGLEEKERKEPK